VPVTKCWSANSALLLWWLGDRPLMKLTMGPLYTVITIAPITVITVPTTLAALWNFLKFTVSNLINYQNNIILLDHLLGHDK
jgi:hypothetical protein